MQLFFNAYNKEATLLHWVRDRIGQYHVAEIKCLTYSIKGLPIIIEKLKSVCVYISTNLNHSVHFDIHKNIVFLPQPPTVREWVNRTAVRSGMITHSILTVK